MKSELHEKLEALAFNRTTPFCYGCYKEAPTGVCKHCGSDDLMRLMSGVGCEYGTDWIIKEILSEELDPVDLEHAFESSLDGCYPETTKVGWLELDTIYVLKEMDPVAWRCAQSEWESFEAEEGNIFSIDGGCTYYWMSEVEELV